MRRAPVFILLLITVAYFGNGVADAVFPDYIPARPYSAIFVHAAPQLSTVTITNSLMSDLLGAALIILLFSSLLVQIANRTTGIVISHSGFTPNPNVTSSPGVATVLTIIPFLFTGILVFGITKLLESHVPKGGL